MIEHPEWTEVVPPTELGTGQSAFSIWLARHGLDRSIFTDKEIRVDVIRTVDGDRVRFLVQSQKLRGLGLKLE